MTKLALVTGGTRGIGSSISIALKQKNYKVIANYASNDEAANGFSKSNEIEVIKWDVSSYDECTQNISKIKDQHGPIEILVNNAGITKDAPLHKMEKKNWDNVININLNSIFNVTSNVINDMRQNNFGRIVNARTKIGDMVIWNLRTDHSGGAVLNKFFPNIY